MTWTPWKELTDFGFEDIIYEKKHIEETGRWGLQDHD